jgi:molybdopterin-binding protein
LPTTSTRSPQLWLNRYPIFDYQAPSKEDKVMKLSARNQIKGKVVEVRKGATTAHVRIDIGNGVVITSSITNEAVDDLGVRVGDDAIAVIKASDVMVAK